MHFGFVKSIAQFIAAVVAISVGAHTAIGRFTAPSSNEQLQVLLESARCFETVIVPNTTVAGQKECPPPIEFDRVVVSDVIRGEKAIVRTWFRRNRECPFVSWSPEVLASNKIQYGVAHTLGKGLTPPDSDNPKQLTDTYAIQVPPAMPVGPAIFRASIVYECPDSIKTKEIVYYPQNLRFCVLHRSGDRPESCDNESIQ